MRKGEGLIGEEPAGRRAPPEALEETIAGRELARQHSGLELIETSFIMTVSPGARFKEGGGVPHIHKSQKMHWTVVLLVLAVLALLLFEIAML